MSSVFKDPFVDAGLVPAVTARVLALDRDLAEAVATAELTDAIEQAWARALTVDDGGVRFSADPSRFDGWLGLLVLDGFALRDDERRSCPELLGPGDVLPPWAMRGDPRAPAASARTVLYGAGPVRLALLDGDFARRVRPWPQLGVALLDRAVGRSILRAVQRDIRAAPAPAPERAWRIVLHASARWGVPTPDGVRLPPPLLGHRLLGALLDVPASAAADALGQLAADGRLTRTQDGWIVRATG